VTTAVRLVFMGSGRFAVPSLRALLDSRHEVVLLVTQPDKPAGRGHALRMPPTKPVALARSIAVHQPAKVRAPESVELLREAAPECIVVVAYGQIIPKSILDIPPKGIINVHGSILPAYRGAAPIQWAMARGETETGVTTMLMDEGLDTGPILQSRKISIAPDDTGESLERKLAPLGAELLLETLEAWQAERITPRAQDDSLATKAPLIKKEHARIDWNLDAKEIACRVRAFIPWPVAFAAIDEKKVKIFRAEVAERSEAGSPGETLSVAERGIIVACGSGSSIRLIELQAEGKKRMAADAFARGHRVAPGKLWS
jgi:methionyl-tRNA formyltransferase